MLRCIASTVAVFCLVGCHAPTPSLDMFAPYGATRIPPPETGSYGNPDNYYQGPNITAPPVGSGLQSKRTKQDAWNAPLSARPAADESAADDTQTSTTQARVKTAGFQSSEEPTSQRMDSAENRIRIVDADSPDPPDTPAVRVKSASVEPRPIRPPEKMIDISQLPPPARRLAPRVEVRSPQVVSPAGGESAAADRGDSASGTRDGWQSRDSLKQSVRVAGR